MEFERKVESLVQVCLFGVKGFDLRKFEGKHCFQTQILVMKEAFVRQRKAFRRFRWGFVFD